MKQCKLCRKDIDYRAKVCPECGSDQRWFHRFIKITGLINVVAIVAVILAFMQVENARKERISAEAANTSAEAAQHHVDSLRISIRQLAKLYSEVAYIETNDYTILASGAIVYPEIYHQKLDSLMQLVEPDSMRRNLWLKSIRK